MGYTNSIRISDKVLRQKALDFMRTNFRRWSTVVGEQEQHRCGEWGVGRELSYDRSPKALGFDYSCILDPERQYMQCVLNWMARTFGDRKFIKDVAKVCPFTVYDGSESWPVLTAAEGGKKGIGCGPVESDGWFPWAYERMTGLMRFNWQMALRLEGGKSKKHKALIRAELKRLAELWEKCNG